MGDEITLGQRKLITEEVMAKEGWVKVTSDDKLRVVSCGFLEHFARECFENGKHSQGMTVDEYIKEAKEMGKL